MKYKASSPETEITGKSVLIMFCKEFPFSEPSIQDIMRSEDLTDIDPDKWYSQQSCLNVLEKVEAAHGPDAVEMMGFKMLADFHSLPVMDLEADLLFMDTAYQMSHRGKVEPGCYELMEFDELSKRAVMQCMNAYPASFDLGLIKAIVSKHIADSEDFDVRIDSETTSQEAADQICSYIITWK